MIWPSTDDSQKKYVDITYVGDNKFISSVSDTSGVYCLYAQDAPSIILTIDYSMDYELRRNFLPSISVGDFVECTIDDSDCVKNVTEWAHLVCGGGREDIVGGFLEEFKSYAIDYLSTNPCSFDKFAQRIPWWLTTRVGDELPYHEGPGNLRSIDKSYGEHRLIIGSDGQAILGLDKNKSRISWEEVVAQASIKQASKLGNDLLSLYNIDGKIEISVRNDTNP